MSQYDDPYFHPPADITGAEARAYEERIVSLLREAMLPDGGPVIRLTSIELKGERPDTEIVFRYTDTRKPGTFAVRAHLWKEGWVDDAAIEGKLHEAASVGGWLVSAWAAGELEPCQ